MNWDVFSPFIKAISQSTYKELSWISSRGSALCFESSFWVIIDQLERTRWLVNSGTGELLTCPLYVLFFPWKAQCGIVHYTKFHCTYFEFITLIYNGNLSIVISQ